MSFNKSEEFKFEVEKVLEKLSDKSEKGWIKLFTLTRWGDSKEAVYDIRSWHYPENSDVPDKCSKGITMNYDEVALLGRCLSDQGLC